MEKITHTCSYCESTFKLVYEEDEITSQPKFCSFCGEETLAEIIEDTDLDYDDDQELG